MVRLLKASLGAPGSIIDWLVERLCLQAGPRIDGFSYLGGVPGPVDNMQFKDVGRRGRRQRCWLVIHDVRLSCESL